MDIFYYNILCILVKNKVAFEFCLFFFLNYFIIVFIKYP